MMGRQAVRRLEGRILVEVGKVWAEIFAVVGMVVYGGLTWWRM
jgi:hypothetical protein